MNIVAVQLNIAWEDRAANHARVRELIDEADPPAGALIVLPEMFDTGFSMNPDQTDPGEPSISEAFCRSIAVERRSTVLAGVTAHAGERTLANEAVAFDRDGAEVVRYRKMQPFCASGEHLAYPPGLERKQFCWQGASVAPLICYDLRFPELFRPLAMKGAELFVVVANWPAKRIEHWVRLLQARAIENQAFVLGVNRTGDDPAVHYDGRSCLFDPQGVEIFAADAREQAVQSSIDIAAVRDWRKSFPALRDIRHVQNDLI